MDLARSVLENFIKEMQDYENEWGERMQNSIEETFSDESNKKRLAQVIEIQNKYLSKKALSLKQDRRTTLTFSVPPEYDQTITSEKIINNKKLEYETNRDEEPYRIYTMILEEKMWKVDKMAIGSMNWRVTRQIF